MRRRRIKLENTPQVREYNRVLRKASNKMKIGDKVKITIGPLDKIGKIGEVTKIFVNGAMVKIGENKFTAIKFEHLEMNQK